MEQWTDSKLGKDYVKAVYFHPACLIYIQIWAGWLTRWNQDCQEKYQQPQIYRCHHPYGRKWKRTKEKAGLKLNIQKTNIQSHHLMENWWGKKWKQWQNLFLASKITVDDDCSHGIKRFLFLGRKAVTNLDNVLNSKDITLLTKVLLVKAMVFPVIMYECESSTMKKSEPGRIDAFEFVVLKKTLESYLDWKEIKLVNPKGKQPWILIDAEAESPIIWPSDAKSQPIGKDWCWERLRAGWEGGNRGRGCWKASPTPWIWVWANPGRW